MPDGIVIAAPPNTTWPLDAAGFRRALRTRWSHVHTAARHASATSQTYVAFELDLDGQRRFSGVCIFPTVADQNLNADRGRCILGEHERLDPVARPRTPMNPGVVKRTSVNDQYAAPIAGIRNIDR